MSTRLCCIKDVRKCVGTSMCSGIFTTVCNFIYIDICKEFLCGNQEPLPFHMEVGLFYTGENSHGVFFFNMDLYVRLFYDVITKERWSCFLNVIINLLQYVCIIAFVLIMPDRLLLVTEIKLMEEAYNQ